MDPLHSAPGGYAVRKRRLATAAAIAGMAISLLVPSAGSAAPEARATTGAPAAQLLPAAGSPGEFAALEARVARLTRQYRGQLNTLIDAEDAARAAAAAAARLGRRLAPVQREVARLAAASYMGVMQSPMGVVLGGGDTQRMLQEVATLQYLTRQQGTRQQALLRMLAAAQQAKQAARAKIANLARLLAKLAGQRRRVDALPAADLGHPDRVRGMAADGRPRQHHREPLRPRAHLGVLVLARNGALRTDNSDSDVILVDGVGREHRATDVLAASG